MNFDYETLRLVYWALLVLAVTGFVVCDGLVIGTNMLLPLLAKTDADRQAMIGSIAPTSLGLQAWLVVAIALSFAAWPIAYAVLFSCLQFLLLLMLLAWMARPLGLYFRNASENPLWRQNWDKVLAVSGFLLASLLGILCGNLLKGVPFHLDSDMRIFFLGDFWGLFNPFTLLIAAVSLSLLLLYGAAYQQLKCHGEIYSHDKTLVYKAGAAFLILFALAGLWITRLEGYHVTSEIFPNGVTNPLNKFAKRSEGLWLDNYEHQPGLWAVPILAFVGAGATLYLTKLNRDYWAFIAAITTVIMAVLTAAVSLFPFLLPSNRSLNSSLTIWDASASHNTLSTLLWIVAFAFPLLMIASRWAFRFWVDSGRSTVTGNSIDSPDANNHSPKDDYA
ncbi:MAG: cytochrome d ubiquinol oxidase subunit II [Methylococcaceae bacterium]|nr:cytochrome d ubiquinol oxidase subunit II [Methylococcaceae bacterium]